MATQKLDKAEWRPFFDGMSKLLGASRAEIDILSLNSGRPGPFLGITYDHKDDIIEVVLEGG